MLSALRLSSSRPGGATQIWAKQYDRDLTAGDIFAIQDDIAESVAGTIASSSGVIDIFELRDLETKAPEALSSYECVLNAAEYWRVITPEAHLSARTCLEKVTGDDPNYAPAWSALGNITIDEMLYGYNPQPDMPPPLVRAQEYIQRAIDLDATFEWSRFHLAKVAFYRHNMPLFHSEIDRALQLLPNDATMLAAVGHFLSYSGGWERGISLMDKAIALNPHHHTWYHFPYFYDAYRQGKDDEALAAALKLDMPGFFWTHQVLAASYAQVGMMDEAAEAVSTLQELYPGYSIQTMTEMHRLWNYEDDVIDRLADGLRRAGLPEVTN